MSIRKWYVCVFIVCLFLSGCGPKISQSMQMHPQSPYGEDCELTFETSSATDPEPFPGYGQIGIIQVYRAPAQWTDDLKDVVRSRACQMGGELASIAVVTNAGGSSQSALTIYIYRRGFETPDGTEPGQRV